MSVKRIGDMTEAEMAEEMRAYPYRPDRGYAFISYSHMDRSRVYPVVLEWMRAGYNIYIDLDFERHGSDRNWVVQMQDTLARNACRLAVCFRSFNYQRSYAGLLELLTIKSADTTDRHVEQIGVDAVMLDPSSSEDGGIPEELLPAYTDSFEKMRRSMGAGFAGQNTKERDALEEGLGDWLASMSPDTRSRLGYPRSSAEKIMKSIDSAYRDGMTEFFPYISKLVRKWFISQDLNGNDISPDADVSFRFEQIGIARVRDAVEVSADEQGSVDAAHVTEAEPEASQGGAETVPEIIQDSADAEPEIVPDNTGTESGASQGDAGTEPEIITDNAGTESEPIPEDPDMEPGSKAELCWRDAVQGDPEAQNRLGGYYEFADPKKKNGVKRDLRRAVRWFRAAAQQGHVRAQCNLGYLLWKEEEVKDRQEALEWLEKAAKQEDSRAQFYLGNCYEEGGEFLEKDVDRAAALYRLAAAQGLGRAQRRLDELEQTGAGTDET